MGRWAWVCVALREPPPVEGWLGARVLLAVLEELGLVYLEEMKVSLVCLPALASCATAFVLHAPPTAVGGPTASTATARHAPKAGRLAELDATCTRRRCESEGERGRDREREKEERQEI